MPNASMVTKSNPAMSNSRHKSPGTSMSEWYEHIKRQYEITEKQGISAEWIMKRSDSVRENVNEIILQNKKQTDMRLGERISDLQQSKMELQSTSCALQTELEVLDLLRERIRDGIKMFKGKALAITEKCIHIREGRRGIDRSHDEVEKELEAEQKKIQGALDILKNLSEQCEEHRRTLRAALYLVSKDIEDKTSVLSIECDCLNTKETSINLSRKKMDYPLAKSSISVQDWSMYTDDILKSSRKKIHSARNFQVYVNALLKETVEDLRKQNDAVKAAFHRRITEIKDAKARLQIQHYEITRKINGMTGSISDLETSIKEKGAFLALAHTRLEKRANRQGIELVKDEVESTLVKEAFEIKQLIEELEKSAEEAKKSLRTLLKTQLDLEEAINIKTHSLKLDEVDCMAVRQGLEYHNV